MKQTVQPDFTGQNIYIGMDVHKKSWTVSIFSEHHEHKKFTQPPNAQSLFGYLKRTFSGASYCSWSAMCRKRLGRLYVNIWYISSNVLARNLRKFEVCWSITVRRFVKACKHSGIAGLV
jgi:hypothetical protein